MAVSQHTSGTKDFSGDVNTTWDTVTANPETTDGAIQVLVDTSNLVAGDTFEVQLLEKVLSGGTARVAWRQSVSGVQSQPCLMSPTLLVIHGWDVQMRQTAGTGRTFPWSVRLAT
jgi:hypothetical protein